MNYIKSTLETFLVILSGVTEKGSAAIVNSINVTSSDPTVLSVNSTQNADGSYTATVGKPGVANIGVTADPGDGQTISETFPFTVYDPAAEATHFSISIKDGAEATIAQQPSANSATGT